MKPELDQELCRKYPLIFAQRNLPMTQTAMCWGFDCEDGWYSIIDKLCADIQAVVDSGEFRQVEAVQVKEKWGGLRFYIDSGNEKIWTLIEKAEVESLKTCEVCGNPGRIRGGGWLRCLCDEHAKESSNEII